MSFAHCFGILRRAKRRLNLEFTRCFGHGKISDLSQQDRILNLRFVVNLVFTPAQTLCL
ncbi:hypothetical protein [uncultured Campylobacter sp.]|uniref:hypothetical protein n=1 Tax=uncultured Campylobacter sp. TaxID=218934 RepID=UPI00260F0B07|nr:hypothetical protein [uncultured Campylobacter sp.]